MEERLNCWAGDTSRKWVSRVKRADRKKDSLSKQVPKRPKIGAIPEAASTAPAERCQLRRTIRKPKIH